MLPKQFFLINYIGKIIRSQNDKLLLIACQTSMVSKCDLPL